MRRKTEHTTKTKQVERLSNIAGLAALGAMAYLASELFGSLSPVNFETAAALLALPMLGVALYVRNTIYDALQKRLK